MGKSKVEKLLEDEKAAKGKLQAELCEARAKIHFLNQDINAVKGDISDVSALRTLTNRQNDEICWLRDTIQGLTKTRHEHGLPASTGQFPISWPGMNRDIR